MQVTRVVFDVNTFGNTQRSLTMLRNALVMAAGHKVAVVEVPVDDLCCGFFIFDLYKGEAVFSGAGFRTDRGGEGGAGYESAHALLDLFGLKVIPWEEVRLDLFCPDEARVERNLLALARGIGGALEEEDFAVPIQTKPYYLRPQV